MRIFWPEPKWTVAVVPAGLILSGGLLADVVLTHPHGDLVSAANPAWLGSAVMAAFGVAAAAVFWADTRRFAPGRRIGIVAGLVTGGLWVAEIAFNNVSQSSAATRLVIDDSAWAVIAVIILVVSFRAGRRDGWRSGLSAGLWSGTVSGVIAALAALSLVVFLMPVLTGDPLNIAEYAARVPNGIPSLATYFAYETVAGALGHLLVLGTLMGVVLGAVGGIGGWLARRFSIR